MPNYREPPRFLRETRDELLGDLTAATVCADHDPRGHAFLMSATEMSAYAADLAAGEDQLVDIELFPNCRAST